MPLPMGQERMGKVESEKEKHATKKKTGCAKNPIKEAKFMGYSEGDFVEV